MTERGREAARGGAVPPEESLATIRLVVCDVDGTLTDGRLFFSEDGTVSKAFTARDGPASKLLAPYGVQVAILTGRDDPATQARADELGWRVAGMGSKDKRRDLLAYMERHGYAPEETLFVGDDEGDVPAFEVAGQGVAVADAHETAREAADWLLERGGGQGALREVADALIAAREAEE